MLYKPTAPPVANPSYNKAEQPLRPFPTMGQWDHAAADVSMPTLFSDEHLPKKKKYAKEAWPGKKPTPHLLV